jgi:ABC-type uncharacterized transport system permease subunit
MLGSGWAWGLALPAMLAYACALGAGAARLPALALGLGWVLHALALALDVIGAGEPAGATRFGFAQALSATVWLVIGVYLLEGRLLPLPVVRRMLAALALVALALALLYPGPLRPYTGAGWLALHWLLALVSYGLFGVAVLHALWLDAAERRLRSKAAPGAAAAGPLGLPLLRLERLTFGFVEAGFLLLSLTLLLGIATALGTAVGWRWDHKTIFAMLGWVTLALLIGGRHLWGWRGRRATRWLYAGAALLALAYFGSRFVLEVLLVRGG